MSQRQRDDMVILAHIREQHRLSLQSYGRPRMTEELQELGLRVGHRRVGRLMGENGIKIIRTQKYKATTDSNHAFNIAPNLLDQDFSADGPNQKWAGDISYIWTSEGWLYLAVILDLYSRRVIALSWFARANHCRVYIAKTVNEDQRRQQGNKIKELRQDARCGKGVGCRSS